MVLPDLQSLTVQLALHSLNEMPDDLTQVSDNQLAHLLVLSEVVSELVEKIKFEKERRIARGIRSFG